MSQRVEAFAGASAAATAHVTHPEPEPRRPAPRDTVNLRPRRTAELLERSGLPADRARPTNGDMLRHGGRTAAKKLAWDAAKEVSSGATLPFKAAYDILNGLNNIGKATFEGRRVSEKRAFITGLIETLYPALGDRSLDADGARKLGLSCETYRATQNEIYSYTPGSHSTRFEHLKRRLESHEAGVAVAGRILQSCTPEQRGELLHHIRSEMAHTDPRRLAWSDQKQAMMEMLHLRVD